MRAYVPIPWRWRLASAALAAFRAGLYVLIAIGILIIFQLGFTYPGPMQTLFGTTGIDVTIWVRIVLVASSVLFLVELEKAVIRRADRNRNK